MTSVIRTDPGINVTNIQDCAFSVDSIKMITQEAEMTIDLSEQGATAVKHPRDFEMLPCRYGGMILPDVAAETSFLMLAEASFQGPFEFRAGRFEQPESKAIFALDCMSSLQCCSQPPLFGWSPNLQLTRCLFQYSPTLKRLFVQVDVDVLLKFSHTGLSCERR